MKKSETKTETDHLFANYDKTKRKSVSNYQLNNDLKNQMPVLRFSSSIADGNNNEMIYNKQEYQRQCISTDYNQMLNATDIKSAIINEIQYSRIPVKDINNVQYDEIYDLPIKLVPNNNNCYVEKDVLKNMESREITEKLNIGEKIIDDVKIIQNPTQDPLYVYYYTDTTTYINIFNKKRIDLLPVLFSYH
jgi:hypothetical protein